MIPSTFSSGAEQLPWIVYEPATVDGRAVVIAFGSDGLAPQWEAEIRQHAQGLADAGILAVVPDYFKKSPPTPHANSGIVFGSIMARHAEWAKVLQDAVIAVKGIPAIDDSRVGFLGFSLGGFLALRVRSNVQVLVEFFAPYQFPTVGVPPLPPLIQGIGSNSNPTLKVQIHHGEADRLVPVKQHAHPIEAALKADGATVSKITYAGANHGFQGDDAPNKDARDQSRRDALQFFQSNL